MTEGSSALLSRLQQLQCHFTWDLKKDVDLKNLSTRLQDHIELQLGQRGAVARSYSFLAYVRYLQDQQEEALSLLNQSEETIRESYGDESEKRLIVTYGDMAWLKYHAGDFAQSQSYCQRVEDILKLKQIAEKRLSRNPGDGEALALLGQVARAEGNRKEAAEFYEEALNCDKDNEEYLSALCELRLELQGSSSD